TVDTLPVATSAPAEWRFGEAGWSLKTSLDAFGGAMSADLSSSPARAAATVDITKGVEMSALSHLLRIAPISGKLTGHGSFLNGPQPATGQLTLQLDNANPVGIKANPIQVTLVSTLENGKLTSRGGGKGQGFDMTVNSTVPVNAGEGFDIRPDMKAPVEGVVI